VLGRESFLEQVTWTEDGWLRLKSGGHTPRFHVPAPALPSHPIDPPPARDDFDGPELGVQYQTLREGTDPGWLTFTKKPGWLSMRGRKPFNNLDDQSLVARRLTSLHARVETRVEFAPESYREMAGLTCFYDINDFIYLKISYRDSVGTFLSITHQNGPGNNTGLPDLVPVPHLEKVFMRADIEGDSLWFSYSGNGVDWKNIGPKFYTGQLADENNKYGFTGAMVGICVQDMDYERKYAHFDYFEYQDL
jgi:xylan 1,4-beta-xylosidase